MAGWLIRKKAGEFGSNVVVLMARKGFGSELKLGCLWLFRTVADARLNSPSMTVSERTPQRQRLCRTLAGDTEGEGRQALDSHRIPEVSH